MKRGGAGFPLLEMVVSLTILAGIAAFLVVAFRLAGGSIERGEAEAREMARLRAGIGILERSIRSADDSVLPSGDGPAPYFVGEPKKLRLLSSCARSSAPPGGGGSRRGTGRNGEGPPGRSGSSSPRSRRPARLRTPSSSR